MERWSSPWLSVGVLTTPSLSSVLHLAHALRRPSSGPHVPGGVEANGRPAPGAGRLVLSFPERPEGSTLGN